MKRSIQEQIEKLEQKISILRYKYECDIGPYDRCSSASKENWYHERFKELEEELETLDAIQRLQKRGFGL